ncbi:hypothetical protein AAC03nite_08310 [Alicyclobacillus acidoterrestris]|nr:hypothetical protein AAC03nite_08310 [Alicyclobacillus acidoterrestris]
MIRSFHKFHGKLPYPKQQARARASDFYLQLYTTLGKLLHYALKPFDMRFLQNERRDNPNPRRTALGH